ncbi:hypothetical protein ACVWZV_005276 [Bradyrhizobium sp. GM5.1]
MRISKQFRLGLTQPSLDFVDVDIRNDTKVFLSPTAVGALETEWGNACVSLIQNFFRHVLHLIKSGQHEKAEALLQVLREPNETHLGLSAGTSRGRALGKESAKLLWRALSKSEAATSGLLADLEDAALLIPGISTDIISDITTNLIRHPLIEYTQRMCGQHGIPLTPGVESGPLWDAVNSEWTNSFTELPVANGNKLLFVPKAIVRQKPDYDAGEYYRHFLLTHMQQVELDANSSLVELLKNGRRRVTKTSLVKKFGSGKDAIVRASLRYPQQLAKYKASKEAKKRPPLSHDKIAELENNSPPDWDALLHNVISLPTGNADADNYEKAIEAFFTAYFYPMLHSPVSQHKLHEGRKRVDIVYANSAGSGFFHWLATNYPAAQVFIECKNYLTEVANPELDQLAGRFSPSRGKFGVLTCRKFENRQLFEKRCRDTALDDRGFILAIDDNDLRELISFRKDHALFEPLPMFMSQFRRLIS